MRESVWTPVVNSAMLYCFISELNKMVEKDDPYWIQRQYAIRLGKYIEYSFELDSFFDSEGNIACRPDDCILWVGDCLYADAMDVVTERYALDSIDNRTTRKQIKEWYKLGITKRSIFPTDKRGVLDYANHIPNFFVKTEKKGHSWIVSNKKIDDSFWGENGDSFLISDYLDILEDQIGKKEARFIVFKGRILNASRYVHSIYHVVDDSFFVEAERIKGLIDSKTWFPSTYVMDIALFTENGDEYYDVVEINSLSTSLCYINNSIFYEPVPEIESIYDRLNWGYEFCYDYITNKNNYFFNVDNPREYLYRR